MHWWSQYKMVIEIDSKRWRLENYSKRKFQKKWRLCYDTLEADQCFSFVTKKKKK